MASSINDAGPVAGSTPITWTLPVLTGVLGGALLATLLASAAWASLGAMPHRSGVSLALVLVLFVLALGFAVLVAAINAEGRSRP